MLSLWIATALMTSVVGPEPLSDPAGWVDPDAYPRYPLGQVGTDNFRLLVSATGKPLRCDLIGSSGFAALDKLTCGFMMRNSRFYPALDANGQPVVGVWRNSINWQKPGMAHAPTGRYDVSIKFADVPKLKSPSTTVYLLVSANGTVEGCSAKKLDKLIDLSARLCDEVSKKVPVTATLDVSGAPVRSVQDVSVQLIG